MTDAIAVWWVTQQDRELFRDNPDAWTGMPPYIARQLRMTIGRPGRGRLWVPPHIDVDEISWDDNARLARFAEKCAGIVIERRDVPFAVQQPGFVTDECLQPIKMHEAGQGLVEYALILLLVAIIILTILAILGLQVEEMYDMITSRIGVLL